MSWRNRTLVHMLRNQEEIPPVTASECVIDDGSRWRIGQIVALKRCLIRTSIRRSHKITIFATNRFHEETSINLLLDDHHRKLWLVIWVDHLEGCQQLDGFVI